MRKLVSLSVALGVLFFSGAASAQDRTVTLNVKNMTCATCPITVSMALKRVEGVKETDVSLEKSTAVVTYDDELTDVAALTEATTNAGFPSTLSEDDA